MARGTENKRASTLFNLRENSAGGLEPLFEAKDTGMPVIVETYEAGSPSKKRVLMTPHTSNPFTKPVGVSGPENLESTPRLQQQAAQNGAIRASQQIFVSP